MSPVPPVLLVLLAASNDAERQRAWQRFVAEYSRLLLHVARSINASHDDAMDAYAHLLEQLAAEECRQLRKYADDGRSKFTTWVVVVARRICLDLYRRRFGRRREGERDTIQEARDFRRRLQALASEDLDAANVAEDKRLSAEDWVRTNELHGALETALATLPADDRFLLKLRFEDDMAAQEIAQVLGLPSPFHVYRRLTAVTTRLRAFLRARGIESATP